MATDDSVVIFRQTFEAVDSLPIEAVRIMLREHMVDAHHLAEGRKIVH